MHILDKSEDAIRAFLKATGMTREELEQQRRDEEAEDPTPDPEPLDQAGQEKMGAYFEFEIVEDDERDDEDE